MRGTLNRIRLRQGRVRARSVVPDFLRYRAINYQPRTVRAVLLLTPRISSFFGGVIGGGRRHHAIRGLTALSGSHSRDRVEEFGDAGPP
jgi:hypothetical protein